VRVLGAAAGLQVSKMEPDCTGIDFIISCPWEVDGEFPVAMVQVKSWSAPREQEGAWRYGGLTQKRFNALAGPRRIPHFLFLVVVPPDVGRYARADNDLLHLSHAAYWVSLRDQFKIAAPSCERRVPVVIPRQNLLTVESLRALCEGSLLAERLAGTGVARGTEGGVA